MQSFFYLGVFTPFTFNALIDMVSFKSIIDICFLFIPSFLYSLSLFSFLLLGYFFFLIIPFNLLSWLISFVLKFCCFRGCFRIYSMHIYLAYCRCSVNIYSVKKWMPWCPDQRATECQRHQEKPSVLNMVHSFLAFILLFHTMLAWILAFFILSWC